MTLNSLAIIMIFSWGFTKNFVTPHFIISKLVSLVHEGAIQTKRWVEVRLVDVHTVLINMLENNLSSIYKIMESLNWISEYKDIIVTIK